MRMTTALCSLMLTTTLGQTARAVETSTTRIKGDALAYGQKMRDLNVKRLQEIEASMRSKMAEDAGSEEDIAKLRAERHEHMLRQEFIGRLLFQIDTRYAGGDFRTFLKSSLREMATNDATSLASDDQSLWKFMKFASEALGGASEKREDVMAFLDGYMQRSVANPVHPKLYLSSRNYTNGLLNEAGHPLRADVAGEIADKRTREAKVATPRTKMNPKR